MSRSAAPPDVSVELALTGDVATVQIGDPGRDWTTTKNPKKVTMSTHAVTAMDSKRGPCSGTDEQMRDILLLTVDCLRADHMGCYGYKRDTTPSMDALAEDSIRYTSTFSNGPGTRFAFRSLLGGVSPLRLDGAGLPDTAGTTLAEALSDAGYNTAGFANNPFLTRYFRYDRGFDEFYDVNHWEESEQTAESAMRRVNDIAKKVSGKLSKGVLYRTLKRVYQALVQNAESQGVDVGTSDQAVIDEAIDWFTSAQNASHPSFAWVHLMGAHHPYSYEPEARSALGIGDDVPHVRNPEDIVEPGAGDHQPSVDAYDANLRATDREVGRLLNAVEDDTLVYVTGDHGEEFGRHTGFHEASAFQTMSHVPLLTRVPGESPQVVDTPVSHVDVPVSIARYAGAATDETWDGTELWERTEDSNVIICFETTEERMTALVSDGWKLINRGGQLSLFNLATDPNENQSLVDKHPEKVNVLKENLDSEMELILENRLPSVRPAWDPEKALDETVRGSDASPDEPSEEDRRELDDRLESLGYK